MGRALLHERRLQLRLAALRLARPVTARRQRTARLGYLGMVVRLDLCDDEANGRLNRRRRKHKSSSKDVVRGLQFGR